MISIVENIPEKYLYTQKEISELLKISAQAICNWKIKPVKKTGRNVFYDIRDIIKYFIEITIPKKTGLSLEQERAKLAKAQTEKTKVDTEKSKLDLQEKAIAIEKEKIKLEENQMDLAVRKSELLPASEVEDLWTNQVITVRAKLLTIPSRCASTIISLKTPGDVENFLRDVVLEVLEELSSDAKPSTRDNVESQS